MPYMRCARVACFVGAFYAAVTTHDALWIASAGCFGLSGCIDAARLDATKCGQSQQANA